MAKYAHHPLFLIVATLVALAVIASTSTSLNNYKKTFDKISALEKENSQIAGEVEQLEQKKVLSETTFMQEKIIRDELLMQKPGEYVIQLPSNLPPQPTPESSPSPRPIDAWLEILL